jgi:hypothetical protein
MSILKGFVSFFDWMFPPKDYQEMSDDLDQRMQELYDKMGWGEYVNPIKNNGNIVDLNDFMKTPKSKQK